MYFTLISRAILYKEYIEKERLIFEQNPLNFMQQAKKTITLIETYNTENQNTIDPSTTKLMLT